MKKTILPFVIGLFATATSNCQPLQFEVLKNVPYSNLIGGTQISSDGAWKEVSAGPLALTIPFKSLAGAELEDFYIESYGIDVSNDVNYLSLYPLYAENDGGYRDRNYDFSLTVEENQLRSAQSKVSYLIEGTIGNRVLKIEYQNVQFWESAENDSINFQIWLFEDNSKIEFHFGSTFITNPETVFGAGAIVALMEEDDVDLLYQYFLENDCQSPNLIDDKGAMAHYISGIPSNGLVYRFTRPSSSSVNDRPTNNTLIFSNPSSNGIYGVAEKTGEIIVTDVLGKEILKTTLPGIIDISKSPAGVYLYQLRVNGKNCSGRLIKE